MKFGEYTIIYDGREQLPWDFSFLGFSQQSSPLKTGDYTLAGYESSLCIERKRTTGELSLNLGLKSKQFYAELTRMMKYDYRYLILEFYETTLAEFPENSGIPEKKRNKLRMNGNYMLSCIEKIRETYDIEVIYAGGRNNAIDSAISIFNKVIAGEPFRPAIF